MTQNKSIYDLELHESTTIHSGIYVMRVPGGWLYDIWDVEADMSKTGVFVPYHNEFQD